MTKQITALSLTGTIGSGFSEKTFRKALDGGVSFIGCDAGSTDPGPYDLGSGTCNKSREAVKRDLRLMLEGSMKKDMPMLVGSAGGAGGDLNLTWAKEIILEVAREHGYHFKMAIIHSEISKEYLIKKLSEGKLQPLPGAPPISHESLSEAIRFVGLMGIEPFIKALKEGAQVVLAGRSSDAAIFAAIPVMQGFPEGLCWHAAKILECGAACAVHRLYPDCMLAHIRETEFIIEPPNPDMRCSPTSVAAHMLYENAHPFYLSEASGTLDTSESRYEDIDGRSISVSGSRFIPSDKYTIRVEGVRKAGYRTIVIGAISDPAIIEDFDTWLDIVKRRVAEKVSWGSLEGIREHDYQLHVRSYGKGVLPGGLPVAPPSEVLIIFDVLGDTQAIANAVAASVRHTALHNPVPRWTGMVSNVAFPFSPSDIPAGPVYEFCINHVVETDNPYELFPMEVITV